MWVYTKEEFENIPEGSVFEVESETDTEYVGTWSFKGLTMTVSIPKEICVKKGIVNSEKNPIIGTTIYRYEDKENIPVNNFFGMNEYIVMDIIAQGAIVEIESVHDPKKRAFLYSTFEKEFSSSKKEAWEKYIKQLDEKIEHHTKIIDDLRKNREDVRMKLEETYNAN